MDYPLDLYVLVADLDQQQAVLQLLEHRTPSLGIRRLRFEVTKHPQHDAGCFRTSPVLLQTLQRQAARALVLLDREGSGADQMSAEEIEKDLEERLQKSGWAQRASVVVLNPEIEIWVWSASPYVEEVLGWAGRKTDLRSWLAARGFLAEGSLKPGRPKEALRAVLRETQVRPSAALFGKLARKVGLESCQDPGFSRLRNVLRTWFGGDPGA